MWYRHWGLSRHPFDDADSPYVPLPSHDEALYRLVYSIEQGHRQVIFSAEAGLGKTTVLHRAIAESRSPRRRVVLVRPPFSSLYPHFFSLIADQLGSPPLARGPAGHACSLALVLGRAASQVASLQGFHVILAIDDGNDDSISTIARDLNVLAHRGFGRETRLTVIRVGRPSSEPHPEGEDGWTLVIRLLRLTRSQVDDYLNAKLAVAGASERVFTPHLAVTRPSWALRRNSAGSRTARRLESHGGGGTWP